MTQDFSYCMQYGWMMPIFFFAFVLIIMLIGFAMFRSGRRFFFRSPNGWGNWNDSNFNEFSNSTFEKPEDVLKIRLSKGEITMEEYDALLNKIRNSK